jgi:uncharacterized membrane protein YdjX (TVP38/TMEM64 family)
VDAATPLGVLLQIVFMIALPASVASVISSYMVYSIAYYGGKPAIERYGRFLDVEWEELKGMEQHFGTEREKYLVAGFRSIPIVPLSLVSGAAGLFRMDWRSYGVWSFVGMMPRNVGLAFLGWYFRDDFLSLAARIDGLSMWVTVTVVATVAGYLMYRAVDRAVKSYVLGINGSGNGE